MKNYRDINVRVDLTEYVAELERAILPKADPLRDVKVLIEEGVRDLETLQVWNARAARPKGRNQSQAARMIGRAKGRRGRRTEKNVWLTLKYLRMSEEDRKALAERVAEVSELDRAALSRYKDKGFLNWIGFFGTPRFTNLLSFLEQLTEEAKEG